MYRLEEKTKGTIYLYSVRVCSYLSREKGQGIIIIINNASALGYTKLCSSQNIVILYKAAMAGDGYILHWN